MNREDLMIGDLVNFNGTIDKVQEILFVEGKGYCASFAASATLFPISLDKITPIPITPELLLNNGFLVQNEKHQIYNLRVDDERLLFPDNIKMQAIVKTHYKEHPKGQYEFTWVLDCPWLESLKLQYVHEFQHALKLCKFNKDIII